MTNTAITDLGDFDTVKASNEGVEVTILHPANKRKLGIFIGVLGKHSEVFREIVNERTNKRILREAENARNGKENESYTAEQHEERAIELLVACTTHWRSETYDEKGEVIESKSIVRLHGEDLEHNVPNATKLYKSLIWLRDQVDNGIGNLELFTKA